METPGLKGCKSPFLEVRDLKFNVKEHGRKLHEVSATFSAPMNERNQRDSERERRD